MDKPIVFTDMHHAGLLNSLIMLFEGRLGGSLYRPIGTKWHKQGYWQIFPHPATVQQYLTLAQGYKPVNGSPPLNEIANIEDGVYYCQDIISGYYNKAITFEKFCEMPIDIVIASVPQHIRPFSDLIKRYKPRAKLIYQIGNNWSIEAGLAPNIMASAVINGIPLHINHIQYHQEFSTDIFRYKPPVNTKNIFSFINCFNTERYFAQDWALFLKLEQMMPDWNFKSFGGQCRDGTAKGDKGVAEKMHEARFVAQLKKNGDGYGIIVHNTGAIGRPMIVKKQYYAGKLGEQLMIDGETCIAIDDLSPSQIVDKILYYNDDDRYAEMNRRIYKNFRNICDFGREESELRRFIENLI